MLIINADDMLSLKLSNSTVSPNKTASSVCHVLNMPPNQPDGRWAGRQCSLILYSR